MVSKKVSSPYRIVLIYVIYETKIVCIIYMSKKNAEIELPFVLYIIVFLVCQQLS